MVPQSYNGLSVSEIVSDLRSAFRTSDFDRAEEALMAREAELRRENAELLQSRDLARAEIAELRRELEDARASLRAAEVLPAATKVASDGGKASSRSEEKPIIVLDSDDEHGLPSKEYSPKIVERERSPSLISTANANAETGQAEPGSPSGLADESKSFWDTLGKIESSSVAVSSSSDSDSDSAA